MAIYKAGSFLIDGDTLDAESDYVRKEYDVAKRELERISNGIYKAYKICGTEDFRVIVPYRNGDKKLSLLCACYDGQSYFAKYCQNDDYLSTIFSAKDTKEIAKRTDHILLKTENIVKMIAKKQYVTQSVALEKIPITYIQKTMKKELAEYENGR